MRDDIVVFAAGNQIYADAVVAQDSCYVNEALITGRVGRDQEKPRRQAPLGQLRRQRYVPRAADDVGADSYVSRLTQEAKRAKKPQQSEMMRALQTSSSGSASSSFRSAW